MFGDLGSQSVSQCLRTCVVRPTKRVTYRRLEDAGAPRDGLNLLSD
jgi:hypothetical protein